MTTEMTTELLDEIHPGEILLEEFMKPMHITAGNKLRILTCRLAASATL